MIPIGESLLVSPADGRVLSNGVHEVPDDLPLPYGEWRRISIFMNVFDVHVNRAPVTGEVIATAGNTGEYSTGWHLHFELWINGYSMDPTNFIDFKLN